MTDNIARQPQGIPAGGQFAARSHTEPLLSLAATEPAATLTTAVTSTTPGRPYELTDNGDGTLTYSDAGAETVLEHRLPVTRSDVRRALRCPRSRGRVVDLHLVTSRRFSGRDDIYEVAGPESGAPLVIRVQDGYHRLQVQSGNVHIEVLGSIGGSRTIIEDGATAGVVVDGDNEYMVETRGRGRARISLSPESKVEVRSTGTGAVYVTGGGHGCTISAKDRAVVHQDGPEEDHLPVERPAIWW